MDQEEFRRRLRESLHRNREAFEGQYKHELDSLLGLSKEEIDAITPDDLDMQKYAELIAVVKEASRANLAQAELKNRIIELGQVAVSIASKVPSLATMFPI